jgi:hypothetical protein
LNKSPAIDNWFVADCPPEIEPVCDGTFQLYLVAFGMIPLVGSVGFKTKGVLFSVTKDIGDIEGAILTETVTVKALPDPQKFVEGITW